MGEDPNRRETRVERNYKELCDRETPGSFVEFALGFALFGGGLFLVFQNSLVFSGFSLGSFLGFDAPFGLVLVPFLIGVAVLFFDEFSPLGWILACAGLGAIILGLLAGLHVRFQPTSLFATLLMFGMVFAGLGIILRLMRVRPR